MWCPIHIRASKRSCLGCTGKACGQTKKIGRKCASRKIIFNPAAIDTTESMLSFPHQMLRWLTYSRHNVGPSQIQHDVCRHRVIRGAPHCVLRCIFAPVFLMIQQGPALRADGRGRIRNHCRQTTQQNGTSPPRDVWWRPNPSS